MATPAASAAASPPASRWPAADFVWVDREAGTEIPLSVAYAHESVLNRELGPEALVWHRRDNAEKPLREIEVLVPFTAMRQQVERLYLERNYHACLGMIAWFRQFQGNSNQAEKPHVDFIEALILAQNDPERTRALYSELVSCRGHYLLPVIQNNFAIALGRQNQWQMALQLIEAAVDHPPHHFLTAALVNQREMLQHLLDKPHREESVAGLNRQELRDKLKRVIDRLSPPENMDPDKSPPAETGRPGALTGDMIRQLELRAPSPAARFAEVVTPDTFADAVGHVGEPDRTRADALAALARAESLIDAENWVAADAEIDSARLKCPHDASLVGEADRLTALKRARQDYQRASARDERWRERWKTLNGLKAKPAAAIDATRAFLTELESDPGDAPAAAMRQRVQAFLDELSERLAQDEYDAGRRLEATDPAQALVHWIRAAQHPAWQERASASMARVRFERQKASLVRALETARTLDDFEAIFAALAALKEHASTEALAADYNALAGSIARQRLALLRAAAAAAKTDFSDTKAAAAEAAADMDPTFAEQARKLAETKLEEAASLRLKPVRDILQADGPAAAMALFEKLPPEIQLTKIGRLLRQEVQQADRLALENEFLAKLAFSEGLLRLGKKDFQRALTLLEEAAALAPDNLSLLRAKTKLEFARFVHHIRTLAAGPESAKAVQELVQKKPMLPEYCDLLEEIVIAEYRANSLPVAPSDRLNDEPVSAEFRNALKKGLSLFADERTRGDARSYFIAARGGCHANPALDAVIQHLAPPMSKPQPPRPTASPEANPAPPPDHRHKEPVPPPPAPLLRRLGKFFRGFFQRRSS